MICRYNVERAKNEHCPNTTLNGRKLKYEVCDFTSVCRRDSLLKTVDFPLSSLASHRRRPNAISDYARSNRIEFIYAINRMHSIVARGGGGDVRHANIWIHY